MTKETFDTLHRVRFYLENKKNINHVEKQLIDMIFESLRHDNEIHHHNVPHVSVEFILKNFCASKTMEHVSPNELAVGYAKWAKLYLNVLENTK